MALSVDAATAAGLTKPEEEDDEALAAPCDLLQDESVAAPMEANKRTLNALLKLGDSRTEPGPGAEGAGGGDNDSREEGEGAATDGGVKGEGEMDGAGTGGGSAILGGGAISDSGMNEKEEDDASCWVNVRGEGREGVGERMQEECSGGRE